jgi:hypothetical protein
MAKMEDRPSRAIKDHATRQDLRREMNALVDRVKNQQTEIDILRDRLDLMGANWSLLRQAVDALTPATTQEPGLASGDGGSDLGQEP